MPADKPVEVVQADREARDALPGEVQELLNAADEVESVGTWIDHLPMRAVQHHINACYSAADKLRAFARHRLAHAPPPAPSDARELGRGKADCEDIASLIRQGRADELGLNEANALEEAAKSIERALSAPQEGTVREAVADFFAGGFVEAGLRGDPSRWKQEFEARTSALRAALTATSSPRDGEEG